MSYRQVLLLTMGVACAVFGTAAVLTDKQQTIPHGLVACCCGCAYVMLLHTIHGDLQRPGLLVPVFMLIGIFGMYSKLQHGNCPDLSYKLKDLEVRNKELAEQWNIVTASHVLMSAELEKLQNGKT